MDKATDEPSAAWRRGWTPNSTAGEPAERKPMAIGKVEPPPDIWQEIDSLVYRRANGRTTSEDVLILNDRCLRFGLTEEDLAARLDATLKAKAEFAAETKSRTNPDFVDEGRVLVDTRPAEMFLSLTPWKPGELYRDRLDPDR